MTDDSLYISFVWHMHQPFYKQLDTGEHTMPWVRLHATKDYADMPLVVEECTGMRATFNLVPSLIEQIEEFAKGTANERTLALSRKAAKDLTGEERRFVIEHFFRCNYERMIAPFPRYDELYSRRGWARTPRELDRAVGYFSTGDIRDLQVWFNLVWIDPLLRQRHNFPKSLVSKGTGFSEEEKIRLLDIRKDIIGQIVPTYRRLQEAGIIEVSVSPFYHPILPLIFDTDFARRCMPECNLPRTRFHYPEDAASQIKTARDYYRSRFGIPPRGMWPSEGSVCPEIIPLFAEAGISWIATDEEILALSLGDTPFERDAKGFLSTKDAHIIYQPYRASHKGTEVAVFFRDHFLSDLIGFQYAEWDAEEAADDFVERLKKIRSDLKDEIQPHIVSVILDGENCWEFYPEDGLDFLHKLYKKIVTEPHIKPITPSEFLKSHPPKKTLSEIYTGSWINHNFYIWIGHRDDVNSWEALAKTHIDVSRRIADGGANLNREAISMAKKSLAIAEGSDWNWWYGDDHSSEADEQFDALYRSHLMQAYRAVRLEVPPHLSLPILSPTETVEIHKPHAFLKPTIDGRNTSYFEWLSAGYYQPTSGSMHRTKHLIRRIYYGFDLENLYIRLDPAPDLSPPENTMPVTFVIAILEPGPWSIKVKIDTYHHQPPQAQCYTQAEHGAWTYVRTLDTVAFDRILELAVPLSTLGLKAGMILHLHAIIQREGREIERCPAGIPLRIEVPDSDFEKSHWLV